MLILNAFSPGNLPVILGMLVGGIVLGWLLSTFIQGPKYKAAISELEEKAQANASKLNNSLDISGEENKRLRYRHGQEMIKAKAEAEQLTAKIAALEAELAK